MANKSSDQMKPIFFSDCWGTGGSPEDLPEVLHEVSHEVSYADSKPRETSAKPSSTLCAYCGLILLPSSCSMKEHVKKCNIYCRMIVCFFCDEDLKDYTWKDRCNHVISCKHKHEQKHINSFLNPNPKP